MAHDLVLRLASGAVQPRRVDRQLQAIRLEAVEAAERVSCAAYVTDVALHHVARLSNTEAQLIQQVPLGEPRYRLIGDAFAGVAYAIIAGLALP